MKKYRFYLAGALFVLAAFGACDRVGEPGEPDTLYRGDYDKEAMQKAMESARSTLSHFREAMAAGRGEGHAIKVAIRDGEDTEHFWLIDLEALEEGFRGTLSNDPGIVTNVKVGDTITAEGEQISDWMYMFGGKMHGNFTLRVLIPNMPPEEASEFEGMMAPLPD